MAPSRKLEDPPTGQWGPCPPIESKSSTATSVIKRTRRGYGRQNSKWGRSNKSKQLVMLGTNSAGLNKKRESLFFVINKIKPAVITIQETKLTQYRTLKIPGYEVFEHLICSFFCCWT